VMIASRHTSQRCCRATLIRGGHAIIAGLDPD
jgi:hypothetical protein